jgi:cell division protein FtsN
VATRNRRNRRTDNYVSPSCPPGWAWLLAGVMIGMFISFLIYLREIAPHEVVPPEANLAPLTTANETVPIPPPSEAANDSNELANSAPFEIYDPLMNQPNAKKAAPPNSPAVPPPSSGETVPSSDLPITVPGRYLLQVGSFRDEREAEGLKAHLASIGIPARIESTMLNQNGRWYRVQVGPFTDLNKLNQVRAQLAANSLGFILLKF